MVGKDKIGSVPVTPLKRDERSLEEVGRRYPEAHTPPDFSDHGNIFQTTYQLFALVTMGLFQHFSSH